MNKNKNYNFQPITADAVTSVTNIICHCNFQMNKLFTVLCYTIF